MTQLAPEVHGRAEEERFRSRESSVRLQQRGVAERGGLAGHCSPEASDRPYLCCSTSTVAERALQRESQSRLRSRSRETALLQTEEGENFLLSPRFHSSRVNARDPDDLRQPSALQNRACCRRDPPARSSVSVVKVQRRHQTFGTSSSTSFMYRYFLTLACQKNKSY